jgi:hypothetical protein
MHNRQLRRLLAAMTVFLVVSSAVGAQVAFVTVAKGDASGRQLGAEVVVRTAAEWKALWKEHAPTEKMPAIDFAKQMVLGVFVGSKPTAGYAVEITGVRAEGKDLIVEVVRREPGRGTLAAQILTEPFHLVSVPRHDGQVRFIDAAK